MKKILFVTVLLAFCLLNSASSLNAQETPFYIMKKGETLRWSSLHAAKYTELFYRGDRVYLPAGARIRVTFYNVGFSPARGVYITNPSGINSYGRDFLFPSAPKYCILLRQYMGVGRSKQVLYNYWALHKPYQKKMTIYLTTQNDGYFDTVINDNYYPNNTGRYSLTITRV